MHVVAAKAVALKEAMQPSFKAYQEQTIRNAKCLAEELTSAGFRIISGGTDNHLMLVDVTAKGTTGKIAEKALDNAGITVNKNMIPYDKRKPLDPSGIRIGTPALTTRGMAESEMKQIAKWISGIIDRPEDDYLIAETRGSIRELCVQFPAPTDEGNPA